MPAVCTVTERIAKNICIIFEKAAGSRRQPFFYLACMGNIFGVQTPADANPLLAWGFL